MANHKKNHKQINLPYRKGVNFSKEEWDLFQEERFKNINLSEMIRKASFFYANDQKNFIICPTCNSYVQIKDDLPKGILVGNCKVCKNDYEIEV